MSTTPAERAAALLAEAFTLLANAPTTATVTVTATMTLSWRERLWTAPPETRLGAVEIAEALGVSVRTVARYVEEKKLPCRTRDGVRTFLAGNVRAWLDEQETVEVPFVPKVTPLRRTG